MSVWWGIGFLVAVFVGFVGFAVYYFRRGD